MRAVMLEVPAAFLDERRRHGADIWDEMWKGELHMPPAPNVEHQNVEGELEAWIRTYWTRRPGRRVYHGVNLARARRLARRLSHSRLGTIDTRMPRAEPRRVPGRPADRGSRDSKSGR